MYRIDEYVVEWGYESSISIRKSRRIGTAIIQRIGATHLEDYQRRESYSKDYISITSDHSDCRCVDVCDLVVFRDVRAIWRVLFYLQVIYSK